MYREIYGDSLYGGFAFGDAASITFNFLIHTSAVVNVPKIIFSAPLLNYLFEDVS